MVTGELLLQLGGVVFIAGTVVGSVRYAMNGTDKRLTAFDKRQEKMDERQDMFLDTQHDIALKLESVAVNLDNIDARTSVVEQDLKLHLSG